MEAGSAALYRACAEGLSGEGWKVDQTKDETAETKGHLGDLLERTCDEKLQKVQYFRLPIVRDVFVPILQDV